MKRILLISVLALLGFCSREASAQNSFVADTSPDVFSPICKYIQTGDSDKLSAWFADNLELDILGAVNNSTRNQARRIMKNFFNNYTPKQFNLIHKSGKAPMKYAVGTLDAGGEKFRIILYVKTNEGRSYIQHLKVERE
ncbi:MAG: DUF4783 domain-containing protein [Bacteroidales bacterium]|nr:DUF4783 domain-containing protein [Bacteroidales bacterium]